MSIILEKIHAEIVADKELRRRGIYLYIVSGLGVLLQVSTLDSIKFDIFGLSGSASKFQNTTTWLFVLIVFLLSYYTPCAWPYFKKLYIALSVRIKGENYFSTYCECSGEAGGLMYENAPQDYLSGEVGFHNHGYRTPPEYVFGKFFKRYILYVWSTEGIHEDSKQLNVLRDIGVASYLKSVSYEAKHQLLGLFTHRENFDVLGPYFAVVIVMVAYLIA